MMTGHNGNCKLTIRVAGYGSQSIFDYLFLQLARRMAAMEKNRDEVERKLRWERSKSDYLQERLLEAEEQIREREGDGSPYVSVDYCTPFAQPIDN